MKPTRTATLCLECLGEKNPDRVGSCHVAVSAAQPVELEKGRGLGRYIGICSCSDHDWLCAIVCVVSKGMSVLSPGAHMS